MRLGPQFWLVLGGAIAPALLYLGTKATLRLQRQQAQLAAVVEMRKLDGDEEDRDLSRLRQIIDEMAQQLAREREWRHGAEQRAASAEGRLELCHADLHRCRSRLTARGGSYE